MMTIHERLRAARLNAGYATAQDACDAFDWKYPTYVGHENGSRGITAKAATRYASALRASRTWLLFGTGEMTSKGAPVEQEALDHSRLITGDVEEFVGKTAGLSSAIKKMMDALIPNSKTGIIFTLKSTYLDFGLISGDVLIAATGSDPKDGQVVIANKVDKKAIGAETILCRWLSGHMILSIQSESARLSSGQYAVMATIVGSIRLAK